MTVAVALAETTTRLSQAGVADARIEARLLLQHVLKLSREHLYSHLDAPLDSTQVAALDCLAATRIGGAPLAYLLGTREFYGRTFRVDERVLIPRPETELLVAFALAFAQRHPSPGPRVVDVGTGSGVLAITLAVELPSARIVALDRSPDALEVARDNAARHRVASRIDFVESNLVDAVAGPFDLIVANLPYVPSGEVELAPPEVQREPRLALDGGPDGLDLYAGFFEDAARTLACDGGLFAEIAWDQGARAAAFARAAFPKRTLRVLPDLEGRDRVVAVTPHRIDPAARP